MEGALLIVVRRLFMRPFDPGGLARLLARSAPRLRHIRFARDSAPDDVATVERSRPSPSLPRAPPDAFARPLRGVTASPALTRPSPAASAASARGLAARRAFVVVVGAPIAARFIGSLFR